MGSKQRQSGIDDSEGKIVDKLVEGMQEFRVYKDLDNPYYLDVEYHVLCLNQPEYLVPVKIRDINGDRQLLFEVTGMCCLKEEMEKRTLKKEELYALINNMKSLLKTLDRFLLDLSQVSFEPQNIFKEKEGCYCWLYTPKKQDRIRDNIERLFQWILTVLDYDDMNLIRFAYFAYGCIRKHPFTEKTLQLCLDQPQESAEEKKTEYNETDPAESIYPSFQDYYQPEYRPGYREPDSLPAGEEEKKSLKTAGRLLIFEIICMILTLMFFVTFIVFLWTGIRQNMVTNLKYILAGSVIGMLLCGDGAFCLYRKRKKLIGTEETDDFDPGKVPYPSYNYSWEEKGGTTVLGIRKNMLQPALKNLDSGKISVINEFPYFIGSKEGINQLVIKDPAVSRRHAAIIRGKQTGYYDLQDLRSTNGTWVGELELIYEKPVKLEPGNRIRFANESFEFIMLDCPPGEKKTEIY